MIFMDINMPGIDGLECTMKLRSMAEEGMIDLSNTRIIAHSAGVNDKRIFEKVFDGVCMTLYLPNIVPKPVNLKSLEKLISEFRR
jgi:CheY-like chemotaxis protein